MLLRSKAKAFAPPQGGGKGFFLFCLLVLLSACGFQPLYGTSKTSTAHAEILSTIDIKVAHTPFDKQVKNALEDGLRTRGHAKEYSLTLALNKNSTPIGIEPDGTITRYNIVIDTIYELRRLSDDVSLGRGSSKVITSYSTTLNSDFANFTAERNAYERAAREVAEDIRARLITLFPKETQTAPLAVPEPAKQKIDSGFKK
jgi:LPS-assembly lipoprotein